MDCRLFLIALLPAAFGQTLTPWQVRDEPPFHASASLAQVDAVVTDSRDQPVPNLTAADFELLRGGEPLKILKAAYVQTSRTVILVVDDLGLTPDGVNKVRAGLTRFIDTQFRPGDRAAIVRSSAGIGALQQLTGETSLLREAIGEVRCYPPSVDSGAVDRQERERLSAGSRSALRFAVDGLRQVPGRKAVVWFSENLGMFQNRVEPLGEILNLANRAAAVVSVISPRNSPRDQQPDPAAAGLMLLTEETGGTVIANAGPIPGALDRVLRAQDGYYLIDFQPGESEWRRGTGKLSVKMKRPDLLVRARSSFLGDAATATDDSQQTPRQEMLQALRSPFSNRKLRIRLTPLFGNSAGKGSFVQALLNLDVRGLSYVQELDGSRRVGVDIMVLAFGENGRADQEGSHSFFVQLSEDGYQKARNSGLLFSLNVPVPKPGAYQIRAIVGDETSGSTGYATGFLDAPDISRGQLIISGIVLTGAGGKNPLGAGPEVELTAAGENPAVRVFKPGRPFHYGYELINLHLDDRKQPSVETQTHLFRDGLPVYLGEPAVLKLDAGPDSLRHAVAGTITLASSMEPGDYVIQVTVTDKLARDGPRQASQYADFRVER